MIMAVAMVGAAALRARHELRAVPAAQIPLQAIPRKLQDWACTKEHTRDTYGIEVLTLDRVYRAPGGVEAFVTFQATYTRLGALRDWSLARTTGGWSVTSEAEQPLMGAAGASGRGSPRPPVPWTVRVQRLTQNQVVDVAVSWYTSARTQTTTLGRAELAAWKDRLKGQRVPWLSLYLTVRATKSLSPEQAEQRALQLATLLAPQLEELARHAPIR
jgi:hypothetical protein